MIIDLSKLIDLMATLMILMAVGFGLYKGKIIDESFRTKLSWILINVTQCGLILSSALTAKGTLALGLMGEIVLLSFAMHGLLFLLGWGFARASRAPLADRGTYNYMQMFGNLAFIGFPVIKLLFGDFGDTALVYAAIFNLPFNALAFSVGVLLLSGRDSEAKLELKVILNPPFIASLLAAAIMLFKPAVPALLTNALTMLGDIHIPGGMLAIGASLACIPVRQVFGQWRLYALAVLRLLVTPVIVYFLFRFFISNPVLLELTTVMASMPVAVNTTLLCNQYGGNERLGSSGVFLTTVLSVATIPLVCGLLLG
ncbi:MAG: AEC family transporter [Firmicutes bacterium]|nr:AEC family transporter [Bacillota bacterium]